MTFYAKSDRLSRPPKDRSYARLDPRPRALGPRDDRTDALPLQNVPQLSEVLRDLVMTTAVFALIVLVVIQVVGWAVP